MVEAVTDVDESEVLQVRRAKLSNLRENGFNFPNNFKPQNLAGRILDDYTDSSKEDLQEHQVTVSVAGRIVLRRVMGKASFIHIQDVSGRIQAYVKANDIGDTYDDFKNWDLGDIVGLHGYLFVTKTGELTIHATKISLLTKSLRPLPDKFHGLADQELCYRKRYVDLIANQESRERFKVRSQIISCFRRFMDASKFLEVETPMMHPIPGGALARPFVEELLQGHLKHIIIL